MGQSAGGQGGGFQGGRSPGSFGQGNMGNMQPAPMSQWPTGGVKSPYSGGMTDLGAGQWGGGGAMSGAPPGTPFSADNFPSLGGKPAPGYGQGPGPGNDPYAGQIYQAAQQAPGGGFVPGTGYGGWEQAATANLGNPLYGEGNAGRGYMMGPNGTMVPRSSVPGQGGYADRVAARQGMGPGMHRFGPAEGGYQSSAGQKLAQNNALNSYAPPQYQFDPNRKFNP